MRVALSCVLASVALSGCVNVDDVRVAGPKVLVVGGEAGYLLTTDPAWKGCTHNPRDWEICTPDVTLGSRSVASATSDAPGILEVVETTPYGVLVAGRAEGRATLTLIGAEAGEHHQLVVDVVAADRLEVHDVGCDAGPVPAGSTQCMTLKAMRGSLELAGANLDLRIDAGSLVPHPSPVANVFCFDAGSGAGTSTVTFRFHDLAATRTFDVYALGDVDTITLREEPSEPHALFSQVLLFRDLTLHGATVCEGSDIASEPTTWTTTYTTETPEICTVGLYADTTIAGQSTAVNVMGVAAGTCRVRVEVGTLGATKELAFVP